MSEATYNPRDAAAVAYESLPAMIRTGLTLNDVFQILYHEFQYYDTAARKGRFSAAQPQDPSSLELELLVTYISGVAAQAGQSYTPEQIAYVLKGEDVYFQQLGLIDS